MFRTSSLPNSDEVSEVSDNSSVPDINGNVYVVRITPMEKFTLDQLRKFLTEMDNHSWILAVESKPKLHYHLVIENDDELDDMKARIRSFLFQWWDVRPRGWGNAQYNCQVCEDKDKAISYALKDREEYYFEGYDQEYIDHCIEKSFSKNSPKTFKVEYRELCDEFQSSDMDIQEFMVRFVTLKARYCQQVVVSNAYGYALSNLVLRDPSEAEDIVNNYLSSR